MQASGFRITGDARATKADADILMVDLKSISNLIPALVAKQVEFCVAPAPTPEVVESKGQGHIVLQLSELPPAGRWANFPCCCITGTEKIVAEFPEAVGDYVAGPNHTLPTGGTARFSSPLSVDEFVKKSSIIRYSPAALLNDADVVTAIADHEGLWSHAQSVRLRKQLLTQGYISEDAGKAARKDAGKDAGKNAGK